MTTIGVCSIILLVSLFSVVESQPPGINEILKNYDKRSRPLNSNSEAVAISISMLLWDIVKIDPENMEYSVQLNLYQQWEDLRLRYTSSSSNEYLTLSDVDQVWRPDTYMMNERRAHGHNLMVPNHSMRIYPNGTVHYSSRICVTLSCPMDLRKFPFDEHNCSLILSNYGYSTKDVELIWKIEDKPVIIWQKMDLRLFTMNAEPETHVWYSPATAGEGTHSCLQVNFDFKRNFKHYLVQVYIPLVMLVILSWTSFWLDHTAVTARVLIGVSSLLVMVTQVSSFNENVPAVPYTKAIDIFTGICLTFAFMAFIEFIFANYMGRRESQDSKYEDKMRTQSTTNLEIEIPLGSGQENGNQNPGKEGWRGTLKFTQKYISQFKTVSQRIDGFSRVLFPISFLVFVVIYFLAYC